MENNRDIPMKTKEDEDLWGGIEHWCPVCGKFLGFKYNSRKNFCDNCGQALKYTETEEEKKKWDF